MTDTNFLNTVITAFQTKHPEVSMDIHRDAPSWQQIAFVSAGNDTHTIGSVTLEFKDAYKPQYAWKDSKAARIKVQHGRYGFRPTTFRMKKDGTFSIDKIVEAIHTVYRDSVREEELRIKRGDAQVARQVFVEQAAEIAAKHGIQANYHGLGHEMQHRNYANIATTGLEAKPFRLQFNLDITGTEAEVEAKIAALKAAGLIG